QTKLGMSLLTVFFLAAAPIVTATRRADAPPGPPSNPCPPTNLLDMRLTASGVSAENGFMIDTCSYETTTTLCGISDCKIQSVMCSYFGSTGGAPVSSTERNPSCPISIGDPAAPARCPSVNKNQAPLQSGASNA
ncbi:hypothetical protein R3P38DRAFT_2949592, partial [Favolaschia claudopus]